MRSFFRVIFLALVLLVIALVSALTAMRVAIHGREVAVPILTGLTTEEAERVALENGLLVEVADRFYSAEVPEGRVVTQLPHAGVKVRRGWRVRLAGSLGPQQVAIPDVVGQSVRAAELNLRRRGLELGDVARMRMPGLPPGQVLAQTPPANAVGIANPKVNLLVVAEPPAYVLPNFVGRPVTDATRTLEQAGMQVRKVRRREPPPALGPVVAGVPAAGSAPETPPAIRDTVASQTPGAGQKVTAGSVVVLEIRSSPQLN